MSEGDVWLPKLFRKTVAQRWPGSGGRRTGYVTCWPCMFDCQQTAVDDGQRQWPAYTHQLGKQEQYRPTYGRRGWMAWIPLVGGLVASATDVGLAWCARTAWLQWWDVPRSSGLTADGSSACYRKFSNHTTSDESAGTTDVCAVNHTVTIHHHHHCYFAHARGAKYWHQRVGVSVCLFVCLPFVCLVAYISQKPNFTRFSAFVTCGRGSVFLWRKCDMLCTSGFLDDVMFSCNKGIDPNYRVRFFSRDGITPVRHEMTWTSLISSGVKERREQFWSVYIGVARCTWR